MPSRVADASPRLLGRTAGLLYLVIVLTAPFAQLFVRPALIVRGDAAETAARIQVSEALYRAAGLADLLAFACDVALAAVFYRLLRPAGRDLALVAAFFRLAYAAMAGANVLNHFAALRFLASDGSMVAFTAAQAHELALAAIRQHATGYSLAIVFFGLHLLLLGPLLLRSGFVPRVLGVLMSVAGLAYIVNSTSSLLALGIPLYPYILLPSAVAELGLLLWLLLRGVNEERWRAMQASGPLASA